MSQMELPSSVLFSFTAAPKVQPDEVNRYTTPEYFDVSNSLVDRRNVLNNYAPSYHKCRNPSVGWMLYDERQVGRCNQIQHLLQECTKR